MLVVNLWVTVFHNFFFDCGIWLWRPPSQLHSSHHTFFVSVSAHHNNCSTSSHTSFLHHTHTHSQSIMPSSPSPPIKSSPPVSPLSPLLIPQYYISPDNVNLFTLVFTKLKTLLCSDYVISRSPWWTLRRNQTLCRRNLWWRERNKMRNQKLKTKIF